MTTMPLTMVKTETLTMVMTKNVTINNKIEIYKTYDNNYEGQDIDHDKKQDLVHCCNIFPFHLDGDQYRGPAIPIDINLFLFVISISCREASPLKVKYTLDRKKT